MKKFNILVIFFIFLFTSTNSNAFVNKRYEWWKIRLKKLENKKNLYQKKNPIAGPITGLLENDIETAKEVISIFETNLQNDGSLSNATKKFSPDEIKNEIKKIYVPIFNIYLVDTIQNELNNNKKLADVQLIIHERIKKIISNKYNNPPIEFINSLVTDDWKNKNLTKIYNELLLINLIEQKENINNKNLHSIENIILSKLENINYTTNFFELNGIITSSIIDYYNENNLINDIAFNQDHLDSSWFWKKYELKLNNEVSSYPKIALLINNNNKSDLKKLRFYHNNPIELDRAIFSPALINYSNFQPFNGNEKIKNINNNETLIIPSFQGLNDSISSIDRLRKKSLAAINRTPEQVIFSNIEKRFNKIIDFHFHKTKNSFFRVTERIRIKRTKDNTFKFINENEFQKAKTTFDKAMEVVSDYKKKSVEFLRWQLDSKKQINENKINEFNIKISNSKKHIKFITKCIKKGAKISKSYNNEIHKKFFYLIRNYGVIYKYLVNSTNQAQPEINTLRKKQIMILKEDKSSFMNYLKSSRLEIKKIYKNYVNIRTMEQKKFQQGLEKLKKTIAQYEISKMTNSIEDYMKAFNNINYTEDAFTRYIQKYYEIEKEARSGNLTNELNDAIKSRSLIPLIENFNSDKIMKEFSLKIQLKNEILTSIARIITLLNYYKRNNVEILDHPSLDDFRRIKEKLNKKVEIKIASWVMNESNFSKVDKKIIHMLQYILNRKMTVVNKVSSDISTNDEISIINDDLTINFTIPTGWREEKIASAAKGTDNCIFKLIKSPSKEEIIEVIKLDQGSDTLKEITESWAKKSGLELIKIKWGINKSNDYFWLLTKDRDRNITEIYSISHNNQAFIIRGTSTRDKYRYLKRALGSFFLSLNF